MWKKLTNAVAKFHHDERGMQTLVVVMVLGVATIFVVVMWQFSGTIRRWINAELLPIAHRDSFHDPRLEGVDGFMKAPDYVKAAEGTRNM